MAKDKGKKKEEVKEEPKKGNAGNLKPKEKVIVPAELEKKLKKDKPEVFKALQDLNAAREAGDDQAQRKARMALRNLGFRLSNLEAGKDPFEAAPEKEKKEKKEKAGKEEKKGKKGKEKEKEEEEEELEEEEGGTDLDSMDRDALKSYIREKNLDVTVKKSMSDDDIREAIKGADEEE